MILKFKQISAIAISVAISVAIAYVLKRFFYRVRRPNGRKGGVISMHATVIGALIVSVAIFAKDISITAIMAFLGYIAIRDRVDSGQHYMYQALFGFGVGAGVAIMVSSRIGHDNSDYNDSYSNYEREYYDDIPKSASDERYEADDASDGVIE